MIFIKISRIKNQNNSIKSNHVNNESSLGQRYRQKVMLVFSLQTRLCKEIVATEKKVWPFLVYRQQEVGIQYRD